MEQGTGTTPRRETAASVAVDAGTTAAELDWPGFLAIEQERHDNGVDHNQVGAVIGHVVDEQEWADGKEPGPYTLNVHPSPSRG